MYDINLTRNEPPHGLLVVQEFNLVMATSDGIQNLYIFYYNSIIEDFTNGRDVRNEVMHAFQEQAAAKGANYILGVHFDYEPLRYTSLWISNRSTRGAGTTLKEYKNINSRISIYLVHLLLFGDIENRLKSSISTSTAEFSNL